MVDIIPNSQEIIGHGTFSIIYKARLIVSLHLNLLSKNMNLNHALYERALFFYVLINSVFVKNKITMNEIFVLTQCQFDIGIFSFPIFSEASVCT